jgi:hypothetical protein
MVYRKPILSIFIFFLCCLTFVTKSNAQIFTGDLSLDSQAEVDAFNFSEVTGDLLIKGSDIVNLSPLSTLTSVGERLNVDHNPLLTNINGLSALTSVGGTLFVWSNAALTNLDGLSSLTSVGGDLEVSANAALTNLDGLSGITSSIGGSLTISGNNALTNLEGLRDFTSVGGTLIVSGNSILTNLDGLNGLTSVGGELLVFGNFALNSFCGLYPLLNAGFIGTYTVINNAVNPTQQEIIDGGVCAPTSLEISETGSPTIYELEQNYPNPFNPVTSIKYQLPKNGLVELTIYNQLGQSVRMLFSGNQSAGTYQMQWDGKNDKGGNVSTGLYFYRIKAGSFVQMKKMMLIK